MLLSIKELKAFLAQNNVSTTGCREKRDLVEVIINHQRHEEHSNDSSSTTPHSQSAFNNSHSNTPPQSHSTPWSNSHSSSNTHSSSSNSPSSYVDSVLRQVAAGDFFGLMHNQSGAPHNSTQSNHTQSNRTVINPDFLHSVFQMDGINGVREVQPQTHSGFSTTGSQNQATPPPPHTGFEPSTVWSMQGQKSSKSIRLEDIKNANDIQKLSVKELKVLLEQNFVDYKGCCEKDELIQRALMLWQSKKLNENASAENETMGAGESELCKVCMDSMVDCVLLECGHLVTCVDCGKRMRECPMCRQNITRIVRVFKS